MQVLTEDPSMDERTPCEQLLTVMGIEEYDGVPDRRMILAMLAHDPASPVSIAATIGASREAARRARETLSTDLWAAINTTRSEEHTSDLQSLMRTSYAVFCLKKKTTNQLPSKST